MKYNNKNLRIQILLDTQKNPLSPRLETSFS